MAEDALYLALESVNDEPSFLSFVAALIEDRATVDGMALSVDGFKGEWANQTIAEFLEAASSWAESSDFGLRPGPKPTNPWQLFAMFLWAGRGYE